MLIDINTAILLSIGMIGVPLLVWKPFLILYILVLGTFFHKLLILEISIGSINIYLKDVLVLLYCISLFLAFFTSIIIKKAPLFKISSKSIFLLCLVFSYIGLMVIYMISGYFQGVPLDSCIRRFLNNSYCLFFFMPLLFLQDKRQLKHLIVFIILLSIVFPFWQLYVFFAEGIYSHTSSGTLRLQGSTAATLLTCAILAILIWMRGYKQYLLVCFPIISIIFIAHRSVYIALFIALLLSFFWIKQLGKLFLFSYVTIGLLVLSMVAIEIFWGHSFLSDFTHRGAETFSTTNPTTLARFHAIKDNLYVFAKKPIWGIGFNYEVLSIIFHKSSVVFPNIDFTLTETDVLQPHNFFLRHLSHTGIIGTSIITMIIISVLRRCKDLISREGTDRNVGIFLFSYITYFIIVSLMNTTFFVHGFIFWIFCGITILFSERDDGATLLSREAKLAENISL